MFLANINHALESCRKWVREETLPTLQEDRRLFEGFRVHLEGNIQKWGDAAHQLERAVTKLQSQWADVLSEAQKRLGRKFSRSEYPDPSALGSFWKAELKWDCESPVSTLSLLKEYSAFFNPPQPPNLLDAMAYANELKSEMSKPAGDRNLPPWPPARHEPSES
jgi:hypothetical protein